VLHNERDSIPSPSTDVIRIVGARENNLQSVSVDIPEKCITVFTGVSGSGKSSLVFDTIAAESQRQLNDTFSTYVRHRLRHHAQPDVDSLENLCAAIVVDQRRLGANARSTVGTATDILALIRLLFSRVGQPFVGYSNVFSFNHPDAASGLFDNDKALKDYTDEEWQTLLHAQDVPITKPGPGWPPTSRYKGVLPRIRRNFLGRNIDETKGLDRGEWDRLVKAGPCPVCHGARLNDKILTCRIDARNIATFEEGARVDAGRTVPLDEQQVAAVRVGGRMPEVAEADVNRVAADWKLAMCPPSSDESLLARRMIAIAFQRMIERSRCSIARSPLLLSSRSGGMVLQ